MSWKMKSQSLSWRILSWMSPSQMNCQKRMSHLQDTTQHLYSPHVPLSANVQLYKEDLVAWDMHSCKAPLLVNLGFQSCEMLES